MPSPNDIAQDLIQELHEAERPIPPNQAYNYNLRFFNLIRNGGNIDPDILQYLQTIIPRSRQYEVENDLDFDDDVEGGGPVLSRLFPRQAQVVPTDTTYDRQFRILQTAFNDVSKKITKIEADLAIQKEKRRAMRLLKQTFGSSKGFDKKSPAEIEIENKIAELEKDLAEYVKKSNDIVDRVETLNSAQTGLGRHVKKGKGRKGRRAYPDEEYSSSEDEMEGGRGMGENDPQTHQSAIDNLLNREVNTQAEARAVDAEIRRHQEQMRALLTSREYRVRRDMLNRNPRYQRIGEMCRYTFDEMDDLEGGSIIQPINHKSDHQYCCGGNLVRPINAKTLPFF